MKFAIQSSHTDVAEVQRYERLRRHTADDEDDDGSVLGERCVVMRQGVPAWLAALHDSGATSSPRPNTRTVRPTLDAMQRALVDVTLAMAVAVIAKEVTT